MAVEFIITGDYRKVYQGAYDYIHKNRKYAEETFEIFKDPQNFLYFFKAEVSGRAPNGEFLIINVNYKLTERFQPLAVQVKKNMGEHTTLEEYFFDYTANTMGYKFTSKKMLGEINLSTKHGIHISTPAVSTSLLFFRSKKFQNGAINSYKALISDNQWDLNYNLRMEDISMERISSAPLPIVIKGQHINAIKYRLSKFEYGDGSSQSKEEQKQYLEIYLSKHLTIPDRIDDIKNEKTLEIQYFNPLEKEVE